MFELVLALVGVLAGGVAAVAGFGIGSLLTPVLAGALGMKLAVAAVSIPHFAGTGIRLWRLRSHVDRSLLRGFGLASAAGGLAGALLHSLAGSPVLRVAFGLLLLLAAASELTGLMERVRLGTVGAWLAGGLSGGFGGLVGNQGGIRSAALLAFELGPRAFVATATAIALVVDVARMPVYLVTQGGAIADVAGLVAIATAGVVVGTLVGERVLGRIPRPVFRRLVAGLIGALGVYMLVTGF